MISNQCFLNFGPIHIFRDSYLTLDFHSTCQCNFTRLTRNDHSLAVRAYAAMEQRLYLSRTRVIYGPAQVAREGSEKLFFVPQGYLFSGVFYRPQIPKVCTRRERFYGDVLFTVWFMVFHLLSSFYWVDDLRKVADGWRRRSTLCDGLLSAMLMQQWMSIHARYF